MITKPFFTLTCNRGNKNENQPSISIPKQITVVSTSDTMRKIPLAVRPSIQTEEQHMSNVGLVTRYTSSNKSEEQSC